MAPCRLRQRKSWKSEEGYSRKRVMINNNNNNNNHQLDYHSYHFIPTPIQKTALFACFRFLIFHPFFQGVSWPHLPLCADAHVCCTVWTIRHLLNYTILTTQMESGSACGQLRTCRYGQGTHPPVFKYSFWTCPHLRFSVSGSQESSRIQFTPTDPTRQNCRVAWISFFPQRMNWTELTCNKSTHQIRRVNTMAFFTGCSKSRTVGVQSVRAPWEQTFRHKTEDYDPR